MKKIAMVVICSGLSLNALAHTFADMAKKPHLPYAIGIEGGVATSAYLNDGNLPISQKMTTHGFSGETTATQNAAFGRLYSTYRQDQYFATEVGLFSTTNYKGHMDASHAKSKGHIDSHVKAQAYGVDLTARINPFESGAYLKLGGHLSTLNQSSSLSSMIDAEAFSYSKKERKTGFGWLGGIGYEYAFTPNLATNIGYTYYGRLGGEQKMDAHVYYVGARYHF